MSNLAVGDEIFEFNSLTQMGSMYFHDFITGHWSMFFTYCSDFDSCAVTELGMLTKLRKEFDARNCKLIGFSVGSVLRHESFIRDVEETQTCTFRIPIVSDESGKLAEELGLLTKKKLDRKCISSIFIMDPQRIIQLKVVYPKVIGRNFYEIIRILDSLQLSYYNSVSTPANWKHGEDVLIPHHVSDEKANDLFPKGFQTLKPYYRITPPPDIL